MISARTLLWIRRVVGLTFIGAGFLKLVVLPAIQALRPDLELPSFGDVLAMLSLPGIGPLPMPHAAAVAVCLVEIAGGLAMLVGRGVRWAGGLLAGNMVGALATLSIPAHLGHGPTIAGHALGAEFWRIPLEISMLIGAGLVALSPKTPAPENSAPYQA